MDLTRILALLRQGASIDASIFNKDSPPTPPAPPDPAKQIAAQATATPSTFTPFGSVQYSGDPTGGDPTKPYRADVTLSPTEEALYRGRTDIARAMLGRAGTSAGTLSPTFEFNGGSDPTTNRFFMAQKALLDPVFAKQTDALDQKLANQGLPDGSDAADYERMQLRKSQDQAYSQAASDSLGAGFNQDLAARQQNYNEIAAALAGAQLQNSGGTGGGIDTTNAFANQQAGLNRQYQGQLTGYQADVSNTNTGIGAAAAIAAAFI